MYRIVITKHIDSIIFLLFGIRSSFRSQKSDPTGVPEMYRILISKTYRFNDFPPVWAPELKIGSERGARNGASAAAGATF